MEEAAVRQSSEVAEDAIAQRTIASQPSTSSKTAGDREKGTEATLTREKTEENLEYVTGIKLWAIVICVTLAIFLLLLDISIIGTVSYYFLPSSCSAEQDVLTISGHPAYYHRIPLSYRRWLVRRSVSVSKVKSPLKLDTTVLIPTVRRCSLSPGSYLLILVRSGPFWSSSSSSRWDP
jgi:hypothetical protein